MLNLLPLRLNLKPSWRLVGVFTGVHLLVGYSLVLTALPTSIKMVISLLCILSCGYYNWHYALRKSRFAIVQVEWLCQDEWQIYLNNGCCYRAYLSGESVISVWGHVLYFIQIGLDKSAMTVIITPDSLPTTEFQLVLRLLKNK